MVELLFCVALLGAILALGMYKAPLWGWAGALALAALVWATGPVHGHTGVFGFLLWLLAAGFAVLSIPAIRRNYVSAPVFKFVKGTLPKVSDTEQQALEAGTVGFDAELLIRHDARDPVEHRRDPRRPHSAQRYGGRPQTR